MCGFLKLNFKMLDKNFTIVNLYIKKWIVWKTTKCAGFEVKFKNLRQELYYSDFIYKEVNFVYNDEMCGFLKVNFKILDKNFTIEILYIKK